MDGGPGRVAARHAVAVEALGPFGGEAVLEVGCGRGATAELVCAEPGVGRYVGLDRSATAVAAAARRLAGPVGRGAASFVTVELADANPHRGPFDVVVAVDVNLFWTSPPVRELAVLERLLRPTGRLLVVHHPPEAALLPRIEAAVVGHLGGSGWRPAVRTHCLGGASPDVLVVTATHPTSPGR